MIFRKVGPSMATPGMRPFQRRAMPGGMPGGVSGATTSQVPEPEQQEGLLGGSASLGLLGLGGKSLIDSLGSSGPEGLLPWMTDAMNPVGNAELAPFMNAAISEGGPEALAPWMTAAMTPGTPATDAISGAAMGFDPASAGAATALNFGLGLANGQDPWKAFVGSLPIVGSFLGGLL